MEVNDLDLILRIDDHFVVIVSHFLSRNSVGDDIAGRFGLLLPFGLVHLFPEGPRQVGLSCHVRGDGLLGLLALRVPPAQLGEVILGEVVHPKQVDVSVLFPLELLPADVALTQSVDFQVGI